MFSVRNYAEAALALLVTCHSSLITEEGWMQTNQRADAGWRSIACDCSLAAASVLSIDRVLLPVDERTWI